MQVKTCLTNQFKYLHIYKESPVSFVLFLVKNGSRFETPEESGISHFIEHMMFKQTDKRTTQQIAMDIETIGGQTNAFTSFEYTGYHIKVLEEKFDHAFEILSDILQNGKFTQEDIDIERGNIIEEINMYEDSPSDHVWYLAHGNAYPNTKLGQMIIGTKETVSSFKREDLISYMNKNYLQDDFLIVTVGNFNENKVEENIIKNLKPRKKGSLQIEKAEFRPVQKINFVHKNDAKQAHTVISFEGVETSTPNLYDYEVLEEVLGGGMGSILWHLLREKLGVAYYVGSSNTNYQGTGAFQIYFGANEGKTKLTIDKIFEELDKLKSRTISKEDLERAQNLYFSGLAIAHENISYLAQNYGIQYLLENKIETLEQTKEKIYSVTPEKIQTAANKIFNDNYNITYIASKELV
jgi:predicted Zn-dependent peptidase